MLRYGIRNLEDDNSRFLIVGLCTGAAVSAIMSICSTVYENECAKAIIIGLKDHIINSLLSVKVNLRDCIINISKSLICCATIAALAEILYFTIIKNQSFVCVAQKIKDTINAVLSDARDTTIDFITEHKFLVGCVLGALIGEVIWRIILGNLQDQGEYQFGRAFVIVFSAIFVANIFMNEKDPLSALLLQIRKML